MKTINLPVVAGVVLSLSAFGQTYTHNPGASSGPAFWGAVASANATCGTTVTNNLVEVGKKQTPINIVSSTTVRALLPDVRFRYHATPVEIENNGHVIEVPYQSGSTLRIGSSLTDEYQLLQFHFHAPSEHTVDGKQFDAEMHLVHSNALGELAVVGVLLSKSADATSGILDDIMNHAPTSPGSEPMEGAAVNARDLLPSDHSFFTYTGSLTTPPCTESVRWFVLTHPVDVTSGMLQQFHSLIGQFPGYNGYSNNNRPVAPLNGRTILSAQ